MDKEFINDDNPSLL